MRDLSMVGLALVAISLQTQGVVHNTVEMMKTRKKDKSTKTIHHLIDLPNTLNLLSVSEDEELVAVQRPAGFGVLETHSDLWLMEVDFEKQLRVLPPEAAFLRGSGDLVILLHSLQEYPGPQGFRALTEIRHYSKLDEWSFTVLVTKLPESPEIWKMMQVVDRGDQEQIALVTQTDSLSLSGVRLTTLDGNLSILAEAAPGDSISAYGFSPNGSLLALWRNYHLEVWDSERNRLAVKIKYKIPLKQIAFTSSGEVVGLDGRGAILHWKKNASWTARRLSIQGTSFLLGPNQDLIVLRDRTELVRIDLDNLTFEVLHKDRGRLTLHGSSGIEEGMLLTRRSDSGSEVFRLHGKRD